MKYRVFLFASLKICNFDKKKMGHDAIKLELIEWLTRLKDNQTIEYLKLIKDTSENDSDWWHDLSDEQKEGIKRGLKDIDEGRVIPHSEVVKKYDL